MAAMKSRGWQRMVCLAGPPSMAFNQHLAEKKKKKKSQPQQLILMVMRVARTVTMTTGRTWRAHLPTSQAQNTISCRMACPCGEAPPTSPTKQCLFHLITNTSCQFPVLLPARLCCRPTRRAGLSRFNHLTHCLTHQCQKAALEKN